MHGQPVDTQDPAYRAGKALGEGILSVRPYSVVVTIAEVFLRRDMGERYFNGRTFLGPLVFLLLFRAYFAYEESAVLLWGELVPRDTVMDVFIGGYVLLSLWHFIRQRLKRRKFTIDHTYFVGYSRLFFVPRMLGLGRRNTATYRFIEPLLVLLLAIPILKLSVVLAGLTVYASVRLGYNNHKILAEEWRKIIDILDSQIDSRQTGEIVTAQNRQETRRDVTRREARPEPSSRRPPSPQKTKPLRKVKEHKGLDVDSIQKRLDPRLRDLGD